mmetsp:Transcript_27252/g.63442  ORF Transcript_27252/g.63442 Transcript_27252/m.63442 type:complete len:205 (-) Transcript_27252:216-830(-)
MPSPAPRTASAGRRAGARPSSQPSRASCEVWRPRHELQGTRIRRRGLSCLSASLWLQTSTLLMPTTLHMSSAYTSHRSWERLVWRPGSLRSLKQPCSSRKPRSGTSLKVALRFARAAARSVIGWTTTQPTAHATTSSPRSTAGASPELARRPWTLARVPRTTRLPSAAISPTTSTPTSRSTCKQNIQTGFRFPRRTGSCLPTAS